MLVMTNEPMAQSTVHRLASVEQTLHAYLREN